MDGYKLVDHTKPNKSYFLMLFLKTLKDRIVLYELGIEFQSFGTVNLQDFRLLVKVLAFGRFKMSFALSLYKFC